MFPSPSKASLAKVKVQSPGPEEGPEASPNKVSKSWSFTEKNRGPKHAFKGRGGPLRQNSEGETTPQLHQNNGHDSGAGVRALCEQMFMGKKSFILTGKQSNRSRTCLM